jgi:quercetin dioxygenase-like cupin family protein
MGCGIVSSRAIEAGINPDVNVLEDVSKNFEGAEVSAKVTPLTAGMEVIQHKHRYPHLSILMSGTVVLKTDDWSRIMNASKEPQSVVIEADKYHAVIAITDAVWLCIHSEGKV